MKKKIALVTSLTLGSLLLIGQIVSAENHDHMMNGNEMMMNNNGMMKMMDTIQSHDSQKMVNECKQMMD